MHDNNVPVPNDSDHSLGGIEVITNVVEDKDLVDQKQEVENVGQPEDVEDVSQHLHGLPLYALTFALMLGVLVVGLDGSIIGIAIPRITTDFGTLHDVGWYGSAYLMTQMGLQPTMGKVYTYFNLKWTLVVGVLTFELGSILCATAHRSFQLVLGRAIAGAGTASIYGGATTLMAVVVSMKNRSLMMSVVTSMFAVSAILGPILGGIFADSRLTWRFAFWLNPPLGAVTITLLLLTIKKAPPVHPDLSWKQKITKLDIPGGVILIAGVVCLLLALQWGGTIYSWSNSKVWGCLLGFFLLATGFIATQIYKKDGATFPPRIVSQRSVAASCTIALVMCMGFFTQIYYIPFYFQASKSMSAEAAGLRFLPYLMSNAMATLACGVIITRTKIFIPFAWGGTALYAVGAGLLSTLKVNSNTGQWVGYQIIAGAAYGILVQIPLLSIQNTLPQKDVAIGSALFFFSQSLGGSIGVSAAQNIFANDLQRQLRGINGVDFATVNNAGASGIRNAVKAELLGAVLDAYNHALTRAYILPIATGGVGFLCSLLLEWKKIGDRKKALVTESEKV